MKKSFNPKVSNSLIIWCNNFIIWQSKALQNFSKSTLIFFQPSSFQGVAVAQLSFQVEVGHRRALQISGCHPKMMFGKKWPEKFLGNPQCFESSVRSVYGFSYVFLTASILKKASINERTMDQWPIRLEATSHLWFLDFPRFLCSSSRVPGCSDLFQLGMLHWIRAHTIRGYKFTQRLIDTIDEMFWIAFSHIDLCGGFSTFFCLCSLPFNDQYVSTGLIENSPPIDNGYRNLFLPHFKKKTTYGPNNEKTPEMHQTTWRFSTR